MSSGFRRVQVHLWVWPCCLDPNEQQFVHARHQGGRDDDDDDGHVVSVQIRGFFLVSNNEYVQKKKNSNFWRSPLPYCKHYQPNHKHSTASQHWRWKKTVRFPRKQSPTSQIHTRSHLSKDLLIVSDQKLTNMFSYYLIQKSLQKSPRVHKIHLDHRDHPRLSLESSLIRTHCSSLTWCDKRRWRRDKRKG